MSCEHKNLKKTIRTFGDGHHPAYGKQCVDCGQHNPTIMSKVERQLRTELGELQSALSVREDEVTGLIGMNDQLRTDLTTAREEIEKWANSAYYWNKRAEKAQRDLIMQKDMNKQQARLLKEKGLSILLNDLTTAREEVESKHVQMHTYAEKLADCEGKLIRYREALVRGCHCIYLSSCESCWCCKALKEVKE